MHYTELNAMAEAEILRRPGTRAGLRARPRRVRRWTLPRANPALPAPEPTPPPPRATPRLVAPHSSDRAAGSC